MVSFESIDFNEIGALINRMAEAASHENPYILVDLSKTNKTYLGEVDSEDLRILASWGGTVIYGPNSANESNTDETNTIVYAFSQILNNANIRAKHVSDPTVLEQVENVKNGKHWSGEQEEA